MSGSAPVSVEATRPRALQLVVPPWLHGYRWRWLRTDIVAGVTLAAVAIPECMGYSSIAKVPVVAGLYTIILPTIAFALLGSSRLLVVGADSATAALLASGIAGLGISGLTPGSPEWLAWAGIVALVTGGILVVARLLRLGFLGDFLSTAVLVGFLTGTGISVLTGQIPGMLGVPGSDGHVWDRWSAFLSELGSIDWGSAAFAAVTLVALIGARRFAPRFPVAIMVVAGSIILVAAFGWADDLDVVGPLDGGLPHLGLPTGLSWDNIASAVTVSVGCAIVILAQSAATARSFAQKHGDIADVNRDIVGLSAANLIAGLSSTFVVNGSPTKTQLLDEERGRTQVANITMAGVTLLVVIFLAGLIEDLPHAVLSAIVFLVAVNLIDLHAYRRMWRIRKIEFGIAVFSAVVVVLFGVQTGILTAMVVSLLEMIRRQYRPERFVVGVSEHGRARHYQPARPGLQSLPGLILFRYDADLFYANAGRFADDVMDLIRAAPDPVRWLVLDCTAISDVDYSASSVLGDLISYVHSHHAHFILAGVDPELQSTLFTEGLLADLDPDHVFPTVGAAVRAFEAAYPDAVAEEPDTGESR
ncbi:SulP family inorganic anion transporter [Gordonia rhizosphera]|uniref:Putative sulfate transporter n=1 Tax=Gordonia rhizosphera NBRC 16068 TaxID=1108045 RepID=K6WP10_9ACTN|nr:SulP family inorganic anion transporter [Gordonia rhizosphera]GAB93842.1 putative sulfate transporter [Gordonia rhizosphera NBRC 16068]